MSVPHTSHRSAAASTARSLFLLLLLSCQQIAGILGKSQLCEVETGQTNIILDIEESRGDFIGQQTTPPELPIYGDPHTEIALDLVFPKGNPTFRLDGKKLQLLQPLDRDEENLSHIVFQVSCSIRNATNKRRSIPIIVRVSDVNDNAPRFMNTPYEVTVAESTPVGTTIFRNIQALDKDAGVNGLVEYFIMEGNTNTTDGETMTIADGYGTFAISFPHQGQVTVVKPLDYGKVHKSIKGLRKYSAPGASNSSLFFVCLRVHRVQGPARRGGRWWLSINRKVPDIEQLAFITETYIFRIFIVGFGIYGSSSGAIIYNEKIKLKRLGYTDH